MLFKVLVLQGNPVGFLQELPFRFLLFYNTLNNLCRLICFIGVFIQQEHRCEI